jgi:alpha-tubulin suppressor-like RCC1 family protein
MKRFLVAPALTLALVATACTDTPTNPARPPLGASSANSATSALDLDGEIQSLLSTVFSKGQANAALSRWDNVKRTLAKGDREILKGKSVPGKALRAQFVELVNWIQGKTSEMTAPSGETQAHVAARIVLDMSLYVYTGPTTTPPPVAPASDIALAVVSPADTATVQTPTLHAGVAFPANSVGEPTVVVVTQPAATYPDNCSGPLDTHLCQYPQFYKFNVFPDVRLDKPATVAVCHVNSGTVRNPREGIHDRFRLAHTRPADPANYSDGSTIVDNIEILPLTFSPTLIDCANGDSYSRSPTGFIKRLGLLQRGVGAIGHLASLVGKVIGPKSAYAIDQGGGGLVEFFSDFNVVDPNGLPDVTVAPGLTASQTEVLAGDTLSLLSVGVSNGGDASAGAFVTQLYLAADTALTNSAVQLNGPITSIAGVVMGTTSDLGTQHITIPPQLLPGTYFIGVRADDGGAVSEANESNNHESVRIIVAPPLDPKQSIAAGDEHTCGLTAVGKAYCWGSNTVGQLGNGTTTSTSTPVAVADGPTGPLRFIGIAASAGTTCGVTRDHAGYCWGFNSNGQLGNGTTASTSTPTPVSGGFQWSSIKPGGNYACGLTTDGHSFCWGSNTNGVLGVGDTVRVHSVPAAVIGAPTLSSISSGLFGACGLTPSGVAYCWGNNTARSFGIGNVGTIVGPTPVSGGLLFSELNAGAAHGCAMSGGTAYCWGDNLFGVVGNGTMSGSVLTPNPVVGGLSFTTVVPGTGNDILTPACGITTSGSAYCWGANDSNQLGTSVSLSPTCSFSTNTGPVSFGCTGTPVPVNGSRTYTAIRIGREHVCSITTTHEFVCWGLNDLGQLGSASSLGSNTPAPTVVSGGLRAP